MLEEDDALAAESTSEEDEDCARLKRRARFRRLDSFAGLLKMLSVLWSRRRDCGRVIGP